MAEGLYDEELPCWGDPDAALEFDVETFRWVGRALAGTAAAGAVLVGAAAVLAARKITTIRGNVSG